MARKKQTEADQTEDLGNILDRTWDDFPEEQTLPEGTWRLVGRNAAYMPPRDEGQNGKVVFFFIPKDAKEDVDADALAALGPDYDVTENEVTTTIWIERNRDWANVKSVLAALGVDTDGKTLKEQFKGVRGAEVDAYVTTRSYNRADGSTVTQNVANQFQAAE
jgi:hypothetical protein